jgi:hypothetical protein
MIVLSAALAAHHAWTAGLFIAGIVTIFAGFLVHMARLNLGQPAPRATPGAESPWKFAAMLLVAVPIISLGLALPAPVYELVRRAAGIIGGAQ